MITNKRKNTCFYKIIHFSVQFSAIVILLQTLRYVSYKCNALLKH